MTTATQAPALPASFKILPMTLGLAAFAAVLVPFLLAVSVVLGFRSGGSPGAAVPVHLAAVASLVVLPCVWATVTRKEWAWGLAGAFAAASVMLVETFRNLYPQVARIMDPLGQFLPWLPVTLAIMLAAAWLGIFIQSAWKARNWRHFGFVLTSYLVVAALGFVYASVLLFFE